MRTRDVSHPSNLDPRCCAYILVNDCRACRHDGVFYLDMTGEDAGTPLEELNIGTYLEDSKELHDLSDVEKLGFEIDNLLPLGTTG